MVFPGSAIRIKYTSRQMCGHPKPRACTSNPLDRPLVGGQAMTARLIYEAREQAYSAAMLAWVSDVPMSWLGASK